MGYRYGDKAIAPEMLKMVGIAHKHNAAAKFPGSGGAVVGMCRGDHGAKNLVELRKEYEEQVREPALLLSTVILLKVELLLKGTLHNPIDTNCLHQSQLRGCTGSLEYVEM